MTIEEAVKKAEDLFEVAIDSTEEHVANGLAKQEELDELKEAIAIIKNVLLA